MGAAPRAARVQKLVGLLALLLALLGAVAGLLFYLRGMTPPDLVTLPIREYQSPNWPVNPWVYQDSLVLETCLAAGNVDPGYKYQGHDLLLTKLRDLKKKTAGPVVVYLCALARWREGKVYVLAADAEPERLANWVALDDVMQKLRECPAPGKLLILDLRGAGSVGPFGLLADEVAGKVQATLAREKNLPFFVLCASSAGQSAQVSEELGQSLFAYYLDRGMRGHAAAYAKTPGRITVMELAEYVKGHVDRCAWETHGVRQTPFLVGQGEDFPLARFDEAGSEPVTAKEVAYPAWLREGWNLRDAWLNPAGRPDVLRLGPGLVHELEAVLLRAEQSWRGGGDEQGRIEKGLKTTVEQLKKLVVAINAGTTAPATLAAPIPQVPTNNKLVATFRYSLSTLVPRASDPALKADEKIKAKLDEELKKLKDSLNKQPAEAAWALAETAATMPALGPAQLVLLNQAAPSEYPSGMIVYLQRLQAFGGLVGANGWDWPMSAVQQALRTLQKSERCLAALAQEPAALPWAKMLLTKADTERRAAEKLLFSGTPADWPKAELALQEAERTYVVAANRTQNLRTALLARDRALALLVGLGPPWLGKPRDAREAKTWKDAVASTSRLMDTFVKPGTASPDGMLEAAVGLTKHLDELDRALQARIRRCGNLDKNATGEDYLEIKTLLDCPRLNGPTREDLWSKGRKLGLGLLAKTQALDKAGAPVSGALPSLDQGVERARLQSRLRFLYTFDMIQLAGYLDAGALEKELQAVQGALDDEAVQRLAGRLGNIWPQQLLLDLQGGAKNLSAADRLGRILAPFELATVRSDLLPWTQNPTLALYQVDLAALWNMLRARYEADSVDLEPGSSAQTTYRTWAAEYGRLAASMP